MLRFNTKFTVNPSMLVKSTAPVMLEVVFPRAKPSNDGSNATAMVLLADEFTIVGVSSKFTMVGEGPRSAVDAMSAAESVL